MHGEVGEGDNRPFSTQRIIYTVLERLQGGRPPYVLDGDCIALDVWQRGRRPGAFWFLSWPGRSLHRVVHHIVLGFPEELQLMVRVPRGAMVIG